MLTYSTQRQKTDGGRKATLPTCGFARDTARAQVNVVPFANPTVFNRAAFLERLDDDSELASRFVEGLLETFPPHLRTMDRCASTHDCRDIFALAHRLKGTLGQVGGEVASNVAAQLEAAAQGGDTQTAAELLAVLRIEVLRVTEALRTFLQSEPTPH